MTRVAHDSFEKNVHESQSKFDQVVFELPITFFMNIILSQISFVHSP